MDKMLKVGICLAGIFAILQMGEFLWRRKILKGEYLRKFVHISSAIFIASWPWLISWHWIVILGFAMLTVVIINHQSRTLHMNGDISRQTWGGIIFAIAVIVCGLLTTNKYFFMLAMLQMGLADGLAAVAGEAVKKYRYKVFGQFKSLHGSAIFWLVSLSILGFGLPLDQSAVSYNEYIRIIFVLPPILTILENVSVRGFDNLTVPVTTILFLKLLS